MRRAGRIAAILILGMMLVTMARGIAYRAGWSLPHIMPEGLRTRVMSETEYEQWARRQFYQRFPGEKPLNWRIAEVAMAYYEEQPMGKFVLHENDCSDFVDCIADDALGPGARFRRDSDEHIAMRMRGWFKAFYWASGEQVMPGDIICVEHSPWYPPKEPSQIRHIGVIGSDSYVYDFVKLKSWSSARYGRRSFVSFVAHSPDPREVIVYRLRPEYRFRVKPIPFG